MKRDDAFYFDQAMMLAREAFEMGYSPVGAVLVAPTGMSIAAASRRQIGNARHAEFLVLSKCQDSALLWRKRLILYSTLEPCIMCSGMAAVLKVDCIKWLVDDIWAGASRVYNPDNSYIKKRFPTMEKANYPELHKEAQKMWIDYLVKTGHADAVHYMLGLPEDQSE